MRDGQKRDFARKLRTAMTDAESRVWRQLRRRQLGARFRRQLPIGPYIADFVCLERRLVVEVDGGQHAPEVDADRDCFFRSREFDVLHFWNNDVLGNTEGVCEVILRHLGNAHPHPGLPPQAEEGDRRHPGDTYLHPGQAGDRCHLGDTYSHPGLPPRAGDGDKQ